MRRYAARTPIDGIWHLPVAVREQREESRARVVESVMTANPAAPKLSSAED